MTPLRRAALLGVILASTGVPSWSTAQELSLGGAFAADPTAPVEVTSEALNVDQATGAATFTGDVVIGQGDLRLQAGEVEVRYDEATSAIARLLATGGVTLATPSEAAEAEAADYDLAAQTLTLTGEVLLTQGPSAISADRMVVDLASGTARMEGNVRTILQQAAP
jgi:lipopolysaccharide export system protein LptA